MGGAITQQLLLDHPDREAGRGQRRHCGFPGHRGAITLVPQ
jgi:hypothetical protein